MSLVPFRKKYTIKDEYVVERDIPDGLNVDVEKGANVTVETTIASGEVLEEKAKLDISEKLKEKPSNLPRYIVSMNGEMVSRGDVIARKKTSFSGYRTVSAPCSGVINLDELPKGFVKIMGEARNITIEAGLPGKVVTAIKNKKVSISTRVLAIHPFEIWGRKVIGNLSYLTEKQALGLDLSGNIVICDYSITTEYIRDLQQSGVIGIITGGIDYEVLREIEKFEFYNMSIVSLTGYGRISIDRNLSSLFDDHEGNLIAIDPESLELILPGIRDTKMRNSLDTDVVWLEAGLGVIIYDYANWGMTGIVDKVLGERALVKLDSGEQKTVSVAVLNLVAYMA